MPTGFCININNGANDAGTTLFWDCFDLTGTLVANPPNFPGSNFGFSKQGLAEYTTYQSRVYYPSQQRTTSDRYVCYDFATRAPCTGAFPVQPTDHPGVNGVPGALLAYSLVSDPDVPTCIWELGDVGQYFQFDAVTGLKCNDTGTTARVELAPQFCDGGTGHVQGYSTVEIGGLTPADATAAPSRCWPPTTPPDPRLQRPAVRQNHLRYQRHLVSDLPGFGHVEDLRPLESGGCLDGAVGERRQSDGDGHLPG